MMIRFPPGWGKAFHPQGARRGGSNGLAFMPGYRGSGMQPITATPINAYRNKVTGIPLNGGQAQGTIPVSGKLNLSIGPQGLGTVWYPIQITLSTTTGQLDTALANIYLGPLITPATLVGTGFGNGTYALAIPDMTPGQYLVVAWTGGTSGDTAAANVIGTMDALTTG